MVNVEEVRPTGPDTTHWKVKGPFDRTAMEFDARTTRDQQNNSIAWNTVEGQNVRTSGEVRFFELSPTRSRVDVTINYWGLPGGRVGEIASRAVANPKLMIEQDLRNFKEIVEGVAPENSSQRPAAASARAGGDGPHLGALRLLDEWAADDSGYDEEVLPELKEALDRDRPGYRKLFG